MEEEGHKIIKLNIGNLAVFGFDAPEEVQQDMIRNLPDSAGYSDSKGIFAARKAVMHYTQQQGIAGVTLDDIYLGNGASELIAMATNALLNDGDELLLPAPDYPLWTAVTSLSGGTPVHYLCDEANGWMPNLDDIRAKITPRTKGIVVINPNNPTGALYSDELLKGIVADRARARPGDPGRRGLRQGAVRRRQAHGHRQPVDGRAHADLQLAVQELPLLRLSRRLAGGVGRQDEARSDYIEGLNMLSNMRLCANVPGQWAIQTALGGYQSINDLVGAGGRLRRQRDLAYELITAIPGVTCVKPTGGALHVPASSTPRSTRSRTTGSSSSNCCRETKVMLVQGTGFNWADAGPLPHRVPAARGRPARGDRPHRPLPRARSQALRLNCPPLLAAQRH